MTIPMNLEPDPAWSRKLRARNAVFRPHDTKAVVMALRCARRSGWTRTKGGWVSPNGLLTVEWIYEPYRAVIIHDSTPTWFPSLPKRVYPVHDALEAVAVLIALRILPGSLRLITPA
jgi:hypothetical protein